MIHQQTVTFLIIGIIMKKVTSLRFLIILYQEMFNLLILEVVIYMRMMKYQGGLTNVTKHNSSEDMTELTR